MPHMDSHVFRLPALPLPSPSPFPDISYDTHRSTHTPIVIDNGSSSFRWGFATASSPYVGINAVAKYKERRNNKLLLLFGEAIDAENGAKGQTRTPWEGDILLNFDALENVLDYAFIKLGIDTPSVDHPILMTERLCTPLHSRALTSELLFELYSVPSLAYCVDGIMSFYQNNTDKTTPVPFTTDGLVLSFNTASTSVIPILKGKGILSHAKRIPWGGSQASDYLLKLVQLKYPNFPTRVTPQQSTWMLHTFCDFSTDYQVQLRMLQDPLQLRASEKIIQFPFSVPVAEDKTEEELSRIAEKRKEQGKKLQEMAAKSRIEKMQQKEKDLQHLLNIRDSKGKEGKRDWMNKLQEEGFDDEAGIDETIKKLENDLKKFRKKEADGEEPSEEPSFPLVDVADAELDEEGLKEKKKQKLLKAGFEARARARREKEKEREEKEREERREEAEREADLQGWAQRTRQEHETLMNKIKERTRRKAALSDRKSAAAQARMKSIANLAADDRVPKKKRKAGHEDTFGADDADWAIYRQINTATVSSDEEEDLGQLQVIEQKLLAHDPTFTKQQTHASIISRRSALLTAFKPAYEEGNVEGNTRIHLNVERWRACEPWFKPSMAGVDSAGLGEVIQNILSRFSEAEKGKLVKNIFLTGGPCQYKNLIQRLTAMLRPILPPEMPLQVHCATYPTLDPWHGMARFSMTDNFSSVVVTREEYAEYGAERIRRWWGGNWNGGVIS
ncbi:chromatin remodeling complex subunit [Amanita rubescens]|nr:chromatin remodeling complex subunit [Amanita rubescens]